MQSKAPVPPREAFEFYSPAVACPSCGGQGHIELPEMEAVWSDDELMVPGNGACCLICEDCERTGVVTATAAAAMFARADQATMRAIDEHDPEMSKRLAEQALQLERQLGL